MRYRTKFIDPDNRRTPKTDVFCGRCHKDIGPNQPRRHIHLVDGGPYALHPADEEKYRTLKTDAGDLGCFPVGMDCARIIGMEWTTP